MGHNSKHIINKTMKELHLCQNWREESHQPFEAIGGHGRVTAEVLDNYLGSCNSMGRTYQNVVIRWAQECISTKCLRCLETAKICPS